MKFVLVVGTTETAAIPGISGAGASPAARYHTPAADAEIVRYGSLRRAPTVPVSPTGCPTPALVTRSVRELLGFEVMTIDAGLRGETATPTLDVGATPGRDIREPIAVPNAEAIYSNARQIGATIPDAEVIVGESIPGGTTTAQGVLTTLGHPYRVSSSLPTNPIAQKEAVVAAGMTVSEFPDTIHVPAIDALEAMGDPVLTAISGLVTGALDTGTTVMLAGGTQMIAVCAVLRAEGIDAPLSIATTPYVMADESADVQWAANGLDIDVQVTDPGFDQVDHHGLRHFHEGEAKEGVGMGGALWAGAREGISMEAVSERTIELYEDLFGDES